MQSISKIMNNKIISRLVYIILAIGILYVVIDLSINNFVKIESITAKINEYVNKEFDLKIKVDTDSSLKLNLLLQPTIELNNVSITNMKGNYSILQVKKLEVSVSLIKLLFKKIVVSKLYIIDADIKLDIERLTKQFKIKEEKSNTVENKSVETSTNSYMLSSIYMRLENSKIMVINGRERNSININKLALDGGIEDLHVMIDAVVNNHIIKGNVNAGIKNYKNIRVAVKDFNFDRIDLAGSSTIDIEKKILTADFESKNVILHESSKSLKTNKTQIDESAQATNNSSNAKLPLQDIVDWTIDAKYKIGNLEAKNLRIQTLSVALQNKVGLITALIDSKKDNFKIDLTYNINKQNYAASKLDLKLIGNKINISNMLLDESRQPMIKAAKGDTYLSITSKGDSVALLKRNLFGDIKNDFSDVSLVIKDKSSLKSMLLASLSKKSDDGTENRNLRCVVANFKINNGVLFTKKGIALETGEVAVQGDGNVNLVNKQISLTMNTHFYNNRALDDFAIVDLYKIGGTYDAPSLLIDPMSIVVKKQDFFTQMLPTEIQGIVKEVLPEKAKDPNPCETARKFG